MAASIQSLVLLHVSQLPIQLIQKERRKVSVLVVRRGCENQHRAKCGNLKTHANNVVVCHFASTASSKTESGHEVFLYEALREGLEEEMERDGRVIVRGREVGSSKVTKGLLEKYGVPRRRVVDAPYAEETLVEVGTRAAFHDHLRPVIEATCMGTHLLSFKIFHPPKSKSIPGPLVIRGPSGVGPHSFLRLDPYFHLDSVLGVRMVVFSTPYNAKGLLKATIRSDYPVLFFEHALLYNVVGRIPDDEEYVLSLDEAEEVRPGKDVTIVTYLRMRGQVMEAAATLVDKGYDPEVIDIRSLKPFDLPTIGVSLKKTLRVLIVEECKTAGVGHTLKAAIHQEFPHYLAAPVLIVTSLALPSLYNLPSQNSTLIQPNRIVTSVEELFR